MQIVVRGSGSSFRPQRRLKVLLVIGGVLCCLLLLAAWQFLPLLDWTRRFGIWAQELGPVGILFISAGYVLGTLLCLPGWPLTFVVAFAYGWWALVICFLGGMAAALIAFWIGRTIGRRPVQRIVARFPKLRAVNEVGQDEPFKTVLLARLTPVTPFSVENYVFGAADLRPSDYALATLIGIVPGTILNVWLGVIGRTAVTGEAGVARWLFLIGGLITSQAQFGALLHCERPMSGIASISGTKRGSPRVGS